MLNKAGSNKYINTYLIFICVLRVRLVCSRYMVKCSEVNVPAHVTDYNTPPCFEKDSAMGQKGALWAWTKISKDMLKIYGKRDKYVSRTIYIYTGPNKDIYRTKQGYIHFGQTHFGTKTRTGHKTVLELTGDKRKWPKLGIRKLTTHMTKWIWANRSFIGKAYGQ